MHKKRPLSLFILFSALAKSLLGLFNTIFLYKIGFAVQEIFYYFLTFYTTALFICPLTVFLGRRIGYKKLLIPSAILFFLSYYYLAFFVKSLLDLFVFAFLFGSSIFSYWMIRHHFELQEFKDAKVGRKVGILLIISQITSLLSGMISAFLLEKFSLFTLVIVASSFFFLSIVPLYFVQEEKNKKSATPVRISHYLSQIPFPTLLHLILREGKTGLSETFSLYLFIYVNNTYGFVGVTNFLVGFASIIFTYVFSKRIDKKREEYLLLSVVLLCIVYLGKLNTTSSLLLTLIFFGEGFIKQLYSLVTDSHYYGFSTKFDKDTYILGQEILYNISRIFIFSFGLILPNLGKFIYFCIGLLVLSGFIPFSISRKDELKKCENE